MEDGSLVKEIKEAHSDKFFGLESSPDGSQFASCGVDRLAKTFDVENSRLIYTSEDHTHHILEITWQCGGRLLATSGVDNVIKV